MDYLNTASHRTWGLVFLSSVLLSAELDLSTLHAQQPFLLKDIDSRTPSYPEQVAQVGGLIFYYVLSQGSSGNLDCSLWRTDGTEAGTACFRDFLGQSEDWSASIPTAVGGLLYFPAADGEHGRGLWVSDGTAAGTRLVKVISPGYLGKLTAVGSSVYFVVYDSINLGEELWISDGTEMGTHLVKDINPGSGRAFPSELTAVSGMLYFTAKDGSTGRELWISDGTENGTHLVRDIRIGPQDSNPRCLMPIGNFVFFWANDGEHGHEIWISDGTGVGTKLVRDVWPGPNSSATFWGPPQILALNDLLYFPANDGQHGGEMWVSDGSELGTRMLRDINPDPEGSAAQGATLGRNLIYFWADDGEHGLELWATDGTGHGTKLIRDICPGPCSGVSLWPSVQMTAIDDTLFFAANDGKRGVELWITHGAEEKTRLLRDIWPGIGSSSPYWINELGGRICFWADDGERGVELWTSDGSEEGTLLLLDWNQDFSHSSLPQFGPAGKVAFIWTQPWFGSNGFHGEFSPGAVWITDGTAEGTWSPNDYPQTGSRNIAVLRDRIYFSLEDGEHGIELWTTDGTKDGTRLFFDIVPGQKGSAPSGLTAQDGTFVFSAFTEEYGRELWISDGTEEGTHLVRDISPGIAGATPSNIITMGNMIFFAAQDEEHGREVWYSDGTTAGTKLLRDIWQGTTGSVPELLTVVGDRFIFVSEDEAHGRELWISDGSLGGTYLLADIVPGPDGSNPAELTAVDNSLYFTAHPGVFRTDGSPEGTRLILPYPNSCSPPCGVKSFTSLGGLVYFIFSSALWVTDGTEGGTRNSCFPHSVESMTAFGDRLCIGSYDWDGGVSCPVRLEETGDQEAARWGYHLLITDGTEMGTVDITNRDGVQYVPAPSHVWAIDRTNLKPDLVFWPEKNLLLFSGDNCPTGAEPWALRLEFVPTPVINMTPDTCQPGRVVTLDASNSTTPENTTVISYSWDMGNGTIIEGARIQYEYPEGTSGKQKICLTVTNDVGFSDTLCRDFCIDIPFNRGNANADETTDLSDAVFLLNYLFLGAPESPCMDAGDTDDNGSLDITDAIYLLNFLFLGGPSPEAPFLTCGTDPTSDTLTCGLFPTCVVGR